jgi:hypothetical protein
MRVERAVVFKCVVAVGIAVWLSSCGSGGNRLPDGGIPDSSKGTVSLKLRKV